MFLAVSGVRPGAGCPGWGYPTTGAATLERTLTLKGGQSSIPGAMVDFATVKHVKCNFQMFYKDSENV